MAHDNLTTRIKQIMTKLQLLSDGQSTSIVTNDSGAKKPGSSPPPGVEPNYDKDKPPPKDRSLYEWYSWHFNRASDDTRRRLLCYLAERDYARVVHKPPQPRGKTGPEDERTGMKRIVEWYQGVDALEVAVLEGVRVEHVHKARRVHGKQASDGRPLPEWSGWSDDERTKKVQLRLSSGMSQRQIAIEFGVSRPTIAKYAK